MTIFGIIIFISIILGVFMLIYKEITDDNWDFDAGFLAFIGTFGITLGIFLIISCFSSINIKYEKCPKFGVTYINSLSVNSSISGNFFLGSGRIENKDYYYYISNSEFGYKISKLENDGNTYVKEDIKINNKPFIEFTKYNAVHINWFAKIIFKNKFFSKDGETIIHVPLNTIIKEYNVDVSKL